MLRPREIMTRPAQRPHLARSQRATTADILPKPNTVIPGSRPRLVTSVEPNPGD